MVWPFSSSEQKSTPPEESKDTTKDDATTKQMIRPTISEEAREIRRRKLVDAVNENCALDSAALLECQDSWSLWNRMTLCQAFSSKYMDCLNKQRVNTPHLLFPGLSQICNLICRDF
jgi:hypothetical protein